MGDASQHDPAAVKASDSKQPLAAPANEKPKPCRGASTAASAPLGCSTDAAAPAKPVHACEAASSDQQASAASSEPARAATASQSREGESPLAGEACYNGPLHSRELKVAAALLVVMRKALQDGRDSLTATKEVLLSNDPQIDHFLRLVPAGGELPGLKQLEGSASLALRDWLGSMSEVCAAADCQPLEMFTRSALCTSHLRAVHKCDSGTMAGRQQRLQAIEKSLALSNAAVSTEKREEGIFRKLCTKAGLLAQHGVPLKLREFITVTLAETICLLDADKTQQREDPPKAGSKSSFTTCIDHMLPGEHAADIHWQNP